MRKPRYYYESNFYHVMVQGDEKKYIFKSYKNKEKYLHYLKHNAEKNGVSIIAYCIMDNHAHVLLFCHQLDVLSKMMLQCNTSFGLYYSNKRQVVGHVFRERFRSEPIYTQNYLISCIKYIHNNPVKAKICDDPKDYYFSSYRNFFDLDNKLKNIMELSKDDIQNIIKSSNTRMSFLEDDYCKEDAREIIKELKNKYKYDKNNNDVIGMLYLKLKENFKINDGEIAELLDIPRTTMLSKLRKIGIK